MIDHMNVTNPDTVPTEVCWGIGELINKLSLDLTEELHDVLGVPRIKHGESAKALFRELIRDAGKPMHTKYLYATYWNRLKTTTNPEQRAVLEWIGRAFTGSSSGYRSNPELSLWLDIKYPIRNALRDGTFDLTSEELEEVATFNQLVLEEIDRRGFQDRCEVIRDRPVISDWDREVFMRHGYVPGDDDSGSDPMLTLSFVNDGEGMRRAIKRYDFDAHPQFPFEKMKDFGQRWVRENLSGLKPEPIFPDIRSVQ